MMKTIYLTDDFWRGGADEDGVNCFLLGEKTHYFDGYKDDSNNDVYVCMLISDQILKEMCKFGHDYETTFAIDGIEFKVIDKRFYKTFFYPWREPEYQKTDVDRDSHWAEVLPPKWYRNGDIMYAVKDKSMSNIPMPYVMGYDGILEDDEVEYNNEHFTVVKVSRLGDLCLSRTGDFPYDLRVSPKDVKLIKRNNPDSWYEIVA